jgi:4-diphosphocytidyl-2-C-methyl-D-erythritol kinase
MSDAAGPLAAGFAPAKLNLALHVTGRRADGWHLLDSLVVFADLGDTVQTGDLPGLTVSGPFAAAVPTGPDNLVLRAAALAGQGAPRLHLVKRLPPASGMGGGTSDAAATLRHFGAVLPVSALMTLGADLPVCMMAPKPARMRGLGEDVAPVADLPGLWLVLVNPGTPLPTPAVFRALARPDNPPLPDPLPRLATAPDLVAWLATQRNDLELPARALAPPIDRALTALAAQPGCALARMTGSGATCFGIFATRETRDAAAAALSQVWPDWWVAPCATLHGTPT